MFVNFALDVLGTTVSCDKVSTDGHECTNLIHTDYRTRKKGYLAEHFVKPPVHVTFSFPCNINISHVVLEPFVGQQQSMRIELLSAHKPLPRTCHGKQQFKANLMNSNSLLSESSLPTFHSVSRISSSSRSPVCFYNPRFTRSPPLGVKSYRDYQIKSEMRQARSEVLTSASHMMVKITQTLKSSTAALNGVEIWGCVPLAVNDEVRQMVEGKYTLFVTPEVPSINPSVKLTSCKAGSISSGSKCENKKTVNENDSSEVGDNFEIPEEFLDPITFEVMTIPLLLPCGKNVDKSSLDRFSDSEAAHGRQPRDPFTGCEFSPTIKPIPNMDLKARIDAFLMSNLSNKSVSTIPRTLGKGIASNSHLGKRKRDADDHVGVSLLVKGPSKKLTTVASETQNCFERDRNRINLSTGEFSIMQRTNYMDSTKTTVIDKSESSLKSSRDAGSSSSSSHSISSNRSGSDWSDIINDNIDDQGVMKNTSDSFSSNSMVSNGGGRYSGSRGGVSSGDLTSADSHDARLKSSLDSALLSVLSTTTTRASNSSRDRNMNNSNNEPLASKPKPNICVWCQTARHGQKDCMLYATPCCHTICRQCLVSLSPHPNQGIECKNCGTSFDKKDVVRAHLSTYH